MMVIVRWAGKLRQQFWSGHAYLVFPSVTRDASATGPVWVFVVHFVSVRKALENVLHPWDLRAFEAQTEVIHP